MDKKQNADDTAVKSLLSMVAQMKGTQLISKWIFKYTDIHIYHSYSWKYNHKCVMAVICTTSIFIYIYIHIYMYVYTNNANNNRLQMQNLNLHDSGGLGFLTGRCLTLRLLRHSGLFDLCVSCVLWIMRFYDYINFHIHHQY